MINWRNQRRKPAAAAIAIVSALTFAAAAQAEETARTVSCTFGESLRLVSTEYAGQTGGEGCKVIYEKRSEGSPAQVIWSARYDMSFCAKKLQSTVDKLSGGGWQCDVSASPDTSAGETTTSPSMPALVARPAPASSEQIAQRSVDRSALGRVLPEKAAAPANTAVRNLPVAIPQKMTESTPSALPLKDQPVASGDQEYDDWIFRWDGSRKKLIFTLYNSHDGRKARSFSWSHDNLDPDAPSPTNIVLARDESANQVLIIAWPGSASQYITVINPLLGEHPICEIETQSKADSGWGYEVTDNKLILNGLKSDGGKLVEFRQPCQN